MKKYSLLILSILIIGCGSDSSYKEQITQYNHFIKKADSLNRLKNYGNAEVNASNAISITDTLPKAFYERGKAYLGLNKLENAIDDFNEMIEIEGENSIGYKSRAIANLYKDEKDEFISDIIIYLKHHNNDLYAHELRGDYYSGIDYDKAIYDYSFCLKSKSGESSLYLKRGNMYAMSNQEKLSIEDYAKYINLNPEKNNDEIFYKRGKLNIKSNNFKEAINDFLMVSESFSQPEIFNFLGDCYFKNGDYYNAIKNYSTYILKTPKNYKAREKRGYAYKKINDFDKADTDFKSAAHIKWKSDSLFKKYWLFILLVIIYFAVGVVISEKLQEVYDGKTFTKGYIYLFFGGLFGTHYLYIQNTFRYILHSCLIIGLCWFINYSVALFYNHPNLLWLNIINHDITIILFFILLTLLILDIILLPYIIFTKNEKIRISINNDKSSKREKEINDLEFSLENLKQNLKSLKV